MTGELVILAVVLLIQAFMGGQMVWLAASTRGRWRIGALGAAGGFGLQGAALVLRYFTGSSAWYWGLLLTGWALILAFALGMFLHMRRLERAQ